MLVFLIAVVGVDKAGSGICIGDDFSPSVLRKLHMSLSVPPCTPCRTAFHLVTSSIMEAGVHV